VDPLQSSSARCNQSAKIDAAKIPDSHGGDYGAPTAGRSPNDRGEIAGKRPSNTPREAGTPHHA
jgi:hypothetical protein